MNDVMRQRLLGILVLVALASILLPLLLDFDTEETVDTQTRLPPAPEIRPQSSLGNLRNPWNLQRLSSLRKVERRSPNQRRRLHQHPGTSRALLRSSLTHRNP